MSHKVRLEDIARECGVTKGLVSRALAGKYNVGENTRSLIINKAVELGYDFDHLHSSKKKVVKVLLVISSSVLLRENFWQPIIKEIYSTLEQAKIKLEYFVYEEEQLDKDMLSKLDDKYVKAYIIMHSNPDSIFNYIRNTGKPIVEVDPKVFHVAGVTQIKFSNYNSTYYATQHLIDLGHKTIAFYGADTNATSFRERHEGFLACMDANKDIKGVNIIFDNNDGQYADNKAFKEALVKEKFTGLVCANDIIALNAYKTINQLGLKIPDDVSVIGFDNIIDGELVSPKLSTFNIARQEIGAEVARYLVNLFSGTQLAYSQITVNCKYIEKESVLKRN